MTAPKPHGRTRIVLDLRQIYGRCTEDGDCLLWGHATSASGIPYAQHNGATANVRRLTWTLQHGMPIRHQQQITATCGNPRCLSPDHLRAKSVAEVHQAMAAMGRYTSPVSSTKKAIGRRKNSKWTIDDIRAIRSDDRPANVVADEHGMSKKYCLQIKAGKAWRELENSVFGAVR